MVINKKESWEKDCSEEVSKETILKISKEIAVKFIEVGKITPATFSTTFTTIHSTVNKVAKKNQS